MTAVNSEHFSLVEIFMSELFIQEEPVKSERISRAKKKMITFRPRELRWAKDPSQMKNETICNLLAKFSTGMSLLDHVRRIVGEL